MTFKHIETCWYFNKLDHRGKPYEWPCCGETSECDEVFVNSLKAENARLREALEFTISAADYLYKTESPVPKGLDPMFYHSLSYEGDVELVEKTKKARAALEGKE